MGAVHGVAYKYVAIAAAASYGAYLSQPQSYARLGLGLIGATNSVIVVLFVADRGTQLLGKDAVTGKAPWYRALPWAGFLLPTWLYTYVHTLVGRVDTAKEVAAALGSSVGKRRGLQTRRSLLGAPPDGYGIAPTYGKGGLRCVKRSPGRARPHEQWHVFEASDAYAQATAESTAGDPNFLAQRVAERPYHAPPLVALATFALRVGRKELAEPLLRSCLLYTSPSPRDRTRSRMPSSA